jgi:hypothetical protein
MKFHFRYNIDQTRNCIMHISCFNPIYTQLNKLTQAVKLLNCIRKVIGSNLDGNADYPDWGFL